MILRTNAGQKKHKCTQCEYSTNLPSNLSNHNMTRSGEKLHDYVLCGKSFRHPHHLKAHMLCHAVEKAQKMHTVQLFNL